MLGKSFKFCTLCEYGNKNYGLFNCACFEYPAQPQITIGNSQKAIIEIAQQSQLLSKLRKWKLITSLKCFTYL